MKKINVTFSIPIETQQLLYNLIEKRKISSFVVEVLNKALEEKMELLKKAYAEAEHDPDRQETINEWKVLEGEDWNE
jgi:hypothetical protein